MSTYALTPDLRLWLIAGAEILGILVALALVVKAAARYPLALTAQRAA